MDVKCERCGTEYEFDDARVTETGVNVKCTHCGHLFKVARRTTGAPEPAPSILDIADEPIHGGTPPPRGSQWMIRRADGETLQFKDLSTLQKWIIERKVSRDDQISKTGQSWKPLGSIVELSSFFLVVDGADTESAPALNTSPPAGGRLGGASRTGPLPGMPPPPPRGRDDLLDTGEFRLEGPGATPSTPIASGSGANASTPPMPPRTPLGTPPPSASGPIPSVRSTWQGRAPVPPPPTPVPEPHPPLYARQTTPTPMPAHTTPFGIEIGAPPPAPERSPGNTARGFVFGVLATGALLFVAYFVFDLLARSRTTPPPPPPASAPASVAAVRSQPPALRPSPNAQVIVKLDRADVEYARDTDVGFERADAEFSAAIESLGEPPADATLAARAWLGRARVAVTRAEYLKLDGKDPAAALTRAEQALATARELAPGSPEVDLGFADYLRVSGERASAQRYADKLEQTAAGRHELAFLRAALPLAEPGADPALASKLLGELPVSAADLPRARYLRAVATRNAGRQEESESLLVELLASVPEHEPAKRLLGEVTGGRVAQAPSVEAKPMEIETIGSEPVPEAPSAPASKAPEVRRPVEPTPAERPAERPAPARPAAGQDYDGLMMQGYRLLESGRSREALSFFEEAANRKDRSPEPWANLGWCYMDQRDYGRAETFFRRALERSPRYADALYGVAEAYERQGRTEQAIGAYRGYLDVHPHGRKAEMAQRKIDRLR